ncbi:M60 family metallopeptidase [Isoptericola sp. BMS4]|uniref:M60 family metallopeptidase n=1 Tax=Isoptericola sp. BMS4 TaxID=2527875 RepID=UPI0014209B63|nr:M60 family metallopeptidase [Isoptericola sp. BMS4]
MRVEHHTTSRRTVLKAGAVGAAGLALAGLGGASAFAAPASQPRSLRFAAKISARTTEIERTFSALSASDLRTTGYYLPPGVDLDVRVTELTAPDAKIVVGAPDSHPDTEYRTPREYPLEQGTVTVNDPAGGVVYAKVVGDAGAVRLSLGASAEPMPYFVLGKTTEPQFQAQLDARPTPYAELVGPHSLVTVERDSILRFRDEDHGALISTLEDVVDIEDVVVSGMDGSAPVHDRLVHPYHFVGFPGAIDGVGAYATHGHMSFPVPIQDRLLTVEGLRMRGWGIYHELGHQHHQINYKPSSLTEVNVNIYSLAVNRAFHERYGQSLRLHDPDSGTGLTPWESAVPKLGSAGVDFFDTFDAYEKLVMFEQLRMTFGDGFWADLHRLTREERPDAGDWTDPPDLRLRNMVVLTSRTAGYDLSAFYRAWGFPVDAGAVAAIAEAGLTPPPVDPTTVVETP